MMKVAEHLYLPNDAVFKNLTASYRDHLFSIQWLIKCVDSETVD